MDLLTFFFVIYLIVGSIYALYLLLSGASTFREVPINILGGPIIMVYVYLKTKKWESL